MWTVGVEGVVSFSRVRVGRWVGWWGSSVDRPSGGPATLTTRLYLLCPTPPLPCQSLSPPGDFYLYFSSPPYPDPWSRSGSPTPPSPSPKPVTGPDTEDQGVQGQGPLTPGRVGGTLPPVEPVETPGVPHHPPSVGTVPRGGDVTPTSPSGGRSR